MSRYHPRSKNFGKPVVRMHLEVETDECTCPRLPGCGGVNDIDWDCPEHGLSPMSPDGKFHTHPMQHRGKINSGRHIA